MGFCNVLKGLIKKVAFISMTEGSDFWCPDGTQSTIVKPNPGRKGEWSVKILHRLGVGQKQVYHF